MLRLVRSGPRIVRITAEAEVADWLIHSIDGTRVLENWNELSSFAGGCTALQFAGALENCPMVVPLLPDQLLAYVINEGKASLIESVERLPRVMLFRVHGAYEGVVAEIARDFNGRCQPVSELFKDHRNSGVTLCFTSLPLNRPVSIGELKDELIQLDGEAEELRDVLQRRALEYFNRGLRDHTWTFFEIKIYDIYERYELQIRRLLRAFGDLELGLTLGEGWGRDYGRMFLPLDVYCLRLYSFLSEEAVKKILIGLEWGSDGERLGDYDLFVGRRKVEWTACKGSLSREELIVRSRESLRTEFCKETLQGIDDMERQLKALQENKYHRNRL